MAPDKSQENGCFAPLGGAKRVYQPERKTAGTAKKNPCVDCHFCQGCSESRCALCLRDKQGSGRSRFRKMSMQEQILLYERINAEELGCKEELVPATAQIPPELPD